MKFRANLVNVRKSNVVIMRNQCTSDAGKVEEKFGMIKFIRNMRNRLVTPALPGISR